MLPNNVFVSELNQYLGDDLFNVCGWEDWDELICLFSALVEYYAIIDYKYNCDSYFKSLFDKFSRYFGYKSISIDDNNYVKICDAATPLAPSNSNLEKSTKYISLAEGSFTNLIAFILNISYYDALATLSNMLGVFLDHLYMPTTYHEKVSSEQIFTSHSIPSYLRCGNWGETQSAFTLNYYSEVKDHCDDPISLFLNYQYNNRDFIIPASISDGYCQLGRITYKAHFFNEHLLSLNPISRVFWFQDMRVAYALQKKIESEPGYDPRDSVIISHLGYDLSHLPLNYLRGREVIYIPAPTPLSLAHVRAFNQACMDRDITRRGISKHFILRHTSDIINFDSASLSHEARQILDYTISINNANNTALSILDTIYSYLVDTKEFRSHYQDIGVLERRSNDPKPLQKAIITHNNVDPRLIPKVASDISDVSMHHILFPGNMILIVGAKEAGKTQTTYLVVRLALQLEKGIMPISRNNNISLGNIIILDDESELSNIGDNLEQHGLKYFIGNKLDIIVPAKAEDFGLPCTFDLTNKDFQDKLEHLLLEKKCRLLILDNLSSMMGSDINSPAYADKFMNFIKKLRAHNICVCYLIHKSTNGDYSTSKPNKGASLFYDLARTVINLQGPSEIRKHTTPLPEMVKEKLKSGVLIVGMRFSTCKMAPVFRDHTLWLYLPTKGSWRQAAWTNPSGELIALASDLPDEKAEKGNEHKIFSFMAVDGLQGLDLKGRLLYECLREIEAPVSVGKLEDFLKNRGSSIGSSDTIRKYLMQLIERNLVVKLGNGRATKYKAIMRD